MSVDTKIFEEFKQAIDFKKEMIDFVLSMCKGFEGLENIPYISYYDELIPYLEKFNYEFIDGEDYTERSWGVFKFNGVYYKANWEYCTVAYEHDHYKICDSLRVVTPVQKTITVWE